MLEGLGIVAQAGVRQGFENGIENILIWFTSVLLSGGILTLDWLGTWWLGIGPPELGPESSAARISEVTRPLLPLFGVIGMALGLVRFGRDRSRESVEGIVGAMIRTVVTVAIVLAFTSLALEWGTVLSPWLVDQIGQAESQTISAILGLETIGDSFQENIALAVIVAILSLFAVIGALVNAVLVLFSYGMAAVIAGILAFFAAMSTTESGSKAFNRLLSWLIAVILFKPVAAIIWGFGLAMAGSYGAADAEGVDQIVGLLVGLVMITASIMALPALVRVIAPITASGPRGMGAGAALGAVGALATGAVLAGATAGVGAAGAGAAGAAGAGASGAGAGSGAGGAAAAGGASGAVGAASGAGTEAAGTAGTLSRGAAQGGGSVGNGHSSGSTGSTARGASAEGAASSATAASEGYGTTTSSGAAKATGSPESGADAAVTSGASADAEASGTGGSTAMESGASPGSTGATTETSGSSATPNGGSESTTGGGPSMDGSAAAATDSSSANTGASGASPDAGGGAEHQGPVPGPAGSASDASQTQGTGSRQSFVERAADSARRTALDGARQNMRRVSQEFEESSQTGEQ